MTTKKSPDFTADDKTWQYIRELETENSKLKDELEFQKGTYENRIGVFELQIHKLKGELKAHKQTYFYKAFQAAEKRIEELEKQLEGYENLS